MSNVMFGGIDVSGTFRVLSRWMRATAWAVALMIVFLTPLVDAQTPNLGSKFPLYVANGLNTILRVDAAGNATAFTSGGYLSNVYRLAVDGKGGLYAANFTGNAIIKIDSKGNQSVFASGGLLDRPWSLVFDTSGNLYVGSTSPGQIIKIDAAGNQSVFASGVGFASDLAFDNKGNLYVLDANAWDGYPLYKIDPSGNRTILTNYSGAVRGMAIDAAGNIYVGSGGTLTVDKIDPSGAKSVFLSNVFVGGLAFDGSGMLYRSDAFFTDGWIGAIYKISPIGSSTLFASDASLTFPFGLAFSMTYQVNGFLAPVSNSPTVNSGKTGRTYPIKWQLADSNGNPVSSLSSVASITSQTVPCSSFVSADTEAITATSTGTSSLRYDSTANQFSYNWQAPAVAGCYTLTLVLDSGQAVTANFSLR